MKPERDPIMCEWSGCQELGEVSTTAGPMCQPHAEEIAAIILERGDR